MPRYIVGVFVAFLLGTQLAFADTSFAWQMNDASLGVDASALGGLDANDALLTASKEVYTATYHDWAGDPGFYWKDIRSPLPMVPGQSKTWTFYLWAGASLPPATNYIPLKWQWGSTLQPPVNAGLEFPNFAGENSPPASISLNIIPETQAPTGLSDQIGGLL